MTKTAISAAVLVGNSPSDPRNPMNLFRSRMKNPIPKSVIMHEAPKANKVNRISNSAINRFKLPKIAKKIRYITIKKAQNTWIIKVIVNALLKKL